MAERKLTVKLIGDERDLLRAYSKSSRATKEFGRTTDTTLVKADKRFKALKGVGAGFAGGLIASEAISQLKRTIDVAAESQAVLTQTKFAVEAAGKSWEQYGGQIDKVVDKQSRLGFDDEALLQSFSNFIRITGKVGESLKLNNLAMDVARARNISLEASTKIVTKAALGQAGALRRIGIDAETGADKVELIRLITEKYGGAAKAAADDASTANQRLAVSLENVQEKIGKAVLPATTALAQELSTAADDAVVLLDQLHGIGKAKIPGVDIPVNFTFPGTNTTIGHALLKVWSKTNPVTGVTGPIGMVKNAKSIADLVTGGGSDSQRLVKTTAAAKAAAERVRDRPVEVTVQIDGETVGRTTKKHAQKDRRRNPKQKRGPNVPMGD